MPFETSVWPFVDTNRLPSALRKFMMSTLVASLYTGAMVLVLICAVAVFELVRSLIDSGAAEYASLVEDIGSVLRASAP